MQMAAPGLTCTWVPGNGLGTCLMGMHGRGLHIHMPNLYKRTTSTKPYAYFLADYGREYISIQDTLCRHLLGLQFTQYFCCRVIIAVDLTPADLVTNDSWWSRIFFKLAISLATPPPPTIKGHHYVKLLRHQGQNTKQNKIHPFSHMSGVCPSIKV